MLKIEQTGQEMVVNVAVFGAFLLIVSVLAIFLWQTLFTSKEHKESREQPAIAQSQQQSDSENALGRSPAPSAHNHTEEAIANYTKWLAIFTLFLVLATIALFISGERNVEVARKSAGAAEEAAKVAERALIAANRPWVKLDFQVTKPIVYNDNGASFTISYVLKNIGHSPATNVWVSPKVILRYPNGPGVSERQLLLQEIAGLKQRPPSPFGFALFPDEVAVHEITVSVSKDEIRKATELIEAIYPIIYGAVDYRMGFDQQSHQTGFIFEIRRNDAPRPSTTEKNRWAAAIWIDEGDVPASEVRLWRTIIDGGYAD